MNNPKKIDFNEAVRRLQDKIPNHVLIWTPALHPKDEKTTIAKKLNEIGLEVREFTVNPHEYKDYLDKAKYRSKRKNIYKNNFPEKTLEHFIGFKFLNLDKKEVFIDIAGSYSPVADIFKDLSGCQAYSHDIIYPKGIHGNNIGSDAGDIPLPNSSVNGSIAACSIEHFEGIADILWMKEMSRLLKKGGRVIVVPLYLNVFSYTVTDPLCVLDEDIRFDDKIKVYARENYGNRHGRHYSPETLINRLIKPNANSMNFNIYLLQNPHEIDPSIYCAFILEGVKK